MTEFEIEPRSQALPSELHIEAAARKEEAVTDGRAGERAARSIEERRLAVVLVFVSLDDTASRVGDVSPHAYAEQRQCIRCFDPSATASDTPILHGQILQSQPRECRR